MCGQKYGILGFIETSSINGQLALKGTTSLSGWWKLLDLVI